MIVAPQARFRRCAQASGKECPVSRLLASLRTDISEPRHTIFLKIEMRHDMRLVGGKIRVRFLAFDFFEPKMEVEVAEGHPLEGA